ncbi:acyl-CoA dehydrogenase family protein [Phenylobacterium sp.]|uniref:acyl-CoA dehydrogenase family protein n=1 Tax=Phenylobacterium sp. TaxID=1871053 RepID=UPI002C1519D5|nr:acyl-CoA dehydrogenase family protein [Phenylobacterium sp.]HLZ74204.1 acyl-CoA dehydrogenase family protein [Phenylobacterium sp.]
MNVSVAKAPAQSSAHDIVARASALVPRLREAQAEIDRLARIPDELVEAFEAAGIYALTIPKAYGGQECSVSTWREVVTELGRGDAGAAWAVTLVTACNWMAAGLYPRHVADEVFAKPGARVAGVFSPRGVKARRVQGGIMVEQGIWFFNSGVYQADWDLLGVPMLNDAGEQTGAGVAIVPMSDVKLLNDWDTSGLRGSGSTNVTMEDVFIPDERIVGLQASNDGRQQRTFPDAVLYRSAFAPLMVSCLTFPTLGAGMHMLEEFMQTLPKRDIKLTPYAKQGEAPGTHIMLGEAAAKLDAAKLLMWKATADIDEWAERREYMPEADRARLVRDSSYADQLVWEAVDLIAGAGGGSFARRTNVLNRVWQDVKVANMHPFITQAVNYEAYGRLICGVRPLLMPI